MISTIKQKGSTYYCSNCLMRQFELKPNCPFCGNMFSNYENMIVRANLDMKPEEAESPYQKDTVLRGRRIKISPLDDDAYVDLEELKQLLTDMKVREQ